MNGKPRIKLPDNIAAGDVIAVRTLISHVMETGMRRDKEGNIVPRDIVQSLVATLDGAPVFHAELSPGISSNPYIVFHVKVMASATLELTWTDNAGQSITERVAVTVN